jgi:hypothetical protein
VGAVRSTNAVTPDSPERVERLVTSNPDFGAAVLPWCCYTTLSQDTFEETGSADLTAPLPSRS